MEKKTRKKMAWIKILTKLNHKREDKKEMQKWTMMKTLPNHGRLIRIPIKICSNRFRGSLVEH